MLDNISAELIANVIMAVAGLILLTVLYFFGGEWWQKIIRGYNRLKGGEPVRTDPLAEQPPSTTVEQEQEIEHSQVEQAIQTGQVSGSGAITIGGVHHHYPSPPTPGPTPSKPVNIFHIPHPPNLNFTGREDQLSAIHDALRSNRPAALTQAIRGLGGVGKTQIAVEYAYRHQSEYDLVWWVKSETTASLAADLAALATPLDLREAGASDQNITISAVLNWLRTHDKWLLIFDNVEKPDQVKPYLPSGNAGHVLITSRYSAWGGVAQSVDVEVWPEPQAVKFLLQRTKEQDEASALALAKELGCLPLALEQAAAYIERDQITLSKYLQRYHDKQTQLFGRKRAKPEGYEGTVLTTWQVSLDKVRELCPESIDLMNLCAFFAPDDIPLEILIARAEHLPPTLAASVQDSEKLDDQVIGTLLDYSLVDRKGDSLTLHRLVQAVIRDNLSNEEREIWAGAAVKVVNEAFPGDNILTDPKCWPLCARLLSHTLAVTTQAETLKVEPDATGRLLNQSALYLRGRAQYKETKALFERAITIGERILGPDDPVVATRVNNLGSVLRILGDLPGAKAHFERALKIDEQTYGSDHPEVGTDVNNLGLVLKDLGDLPGAKLHIERALKIDEQTYGPEHPNVAIDVNNLGSVLRDLGDLPGAKTLLARALEIGEKNYGSDHPNVAAFATNLGGVLWDLGDLPGARSHVERALKIDENTYGPDHPEVATDLHNLGILCKQMGDKHIARECLERALNMFMKFFGPDHPSTKTTRDNLAGL